MKTSDYFIRYAILPVLAISILTSCRSSYKAIGNRFIQEDRPQEARIINTSETRSEVMQPVRKEYLFPDQEKPHLTDLYAGLEPVISVSTDISFRALNDECLQLPHDNRTNSTKERVRQSFDEHFPAEEIQQSPAGEQVITIKTTVPDLQDSQEALAAKTLKFGILSVLSIALPVLGGFIALRGLRSAEWAAESGVIEDRQIRKRLRIGKTLSIVGFALSAVSLVFAGYLAGVFIFAVFLF
ncbi:MAG: hypothetical protein KJ607_04320 [Bacteroidetes bacterium]|nr:hypothetical protein [Bacteroidota bacterium]